MQGELSLEWNGMWAVLVVLRVIHRHDSIISTSSSSFDDNSDSEGGTDAM